MGEAVWLQQAMGQIRVQLGPVKLKTCIQHRGADTQRAPGVQRRGLGWGCIWEKIWEEGKEEKHSRILVEKSLASKMGFQETGRGALWQIGFHGFRALGEQALGAPRGRDFRFLHSKGESLILSLSSFYDIII